MEKNTMQQDEGILEMELTPEMQVTLIHGLNLEIEVMQGKREPLPDGRTRFTLTVTGEKAELVRRFMVRMLAMQEQEVCEN
jgi:hypothetical protein